MNIPKFIEENIRLNDKPIRLYDYQKKFLNDTSDFRIINKSRQIGITQTIAWESLVYAISKPNELVIIVSASQKLANDVMKYVSSAHHSLPSHMKRGANETKEEIVFDNNSRILSLSCNPRTVMGRRATRVYLDEYSKHQEDERMWEALIPSISRGGKATVVSTPMGKRGKFYDFYSKADEMGWSKYEIPWKQCPDISVRIEMIKQGMPDELSFKQEYECLFVDEAVSYFPYELIQECISENLENELKPDKNPIYLGIDFGKVIDSTVLIFVKKIDNKFTVEFIREFKPPMIYHEVSDFILQNNKRWRVDRIIVDQTGVGEGVIEDLGKLGSMVHGEKLTTPFKEKIISNLKIVMQDGRLKIPDNEQLILQLHALKRKYTDSGQVKYTHPTRGRIQHDDYVWALALAVFEGETSEISGGPVALSTKVFPMTPDKKERSHGSAKYY